MRAAQTGAHGNGQHSKCDNSRDTSAGKSNSSGNNVNNYYKTDHYDISHDNNRTKYSGFDDYSVLASRKPMSLRLPSRSWTLQR